MITESIKRRSALVFPAFLNQAKLLVADHAKLKAEPLHLAVYYAPTRRKTDVFLFEVIGE